MKVYQNYEQKFKESKQLKDWFSYFSTDTWDRLSLQSGWREVSATENLVTGLERLIRDEFPRLPFRLFYAKNEPKNGNDLEIVLPVGKEKYVIFPCQAKRLYPNERYDQMIHNGQIVKLLDYAQEIKGYPIYLLYNFVENTDYIKKEYVKQIKYPEELGCTIIGAAYIYNNFSSKNGAFDLSKNPNFKDLHLPAMPLSVIADSMKNGFLESLKKSWQTNLSFEPRYYTLKELQNTSFWNEITNRTSRNMTTNILKNIGKLEDITQPFEPAFRILLTEPNQIIL